MRPKFTREGEIFSLIRKYFNVEDIQSNIKCEGIKILILLSKLNKISDNKLKLFIDLGHLSKIINVNNKEEYILKFLNKKTLKTQRNLSFNNIFQRKNKLKLRGASKKREYSKNYGKSEILKYRKKIWLAIGIDNYDNWNNLNNSVSDINKIDEFFKDKNFNIIKIANQDANKINIEKKFKNYLYHNLNSDDLLVVSFHGHGTTLTINNKNYGFIVPVDAKTDPSPFDLISLEDITNWTKYIKANHVLILLDCCFSGLATMRGTFKISNNKVPKNTITKILSKKNRIVITAGDKDEMVSDGGWGNNSIFTGLLLSYPGLHNSLGSVIDLYSYLLENIPKYSNQIPCIGKLIGDEGGNIFLNL